MYAGISSNFVVILVVNNWEMWSVNQQWQTSSYSTHITAVNQEWENADFDQIFFFRLQMYGGKMYGGKMYDGKMYDGKMYDGHPDGDWMVIPCMQFWSNWPQRIVWSLCCVIVQRIDRSENTNHTLCILWWIPVDGTNQWPETQKTRQWPTSAPPPHPHMKGYVWWFCCNKSVKGKCSFERGLHQMPLSAIESKSDFSKIVFRNQGQSHCGPVSHHFEQKLKFQWKIWPNNLHQNTGWLIGWLVDWLVSSLL